MLKWKGKTKCFFTHSARCNKSSCFPDKFARKLSVLICELRERHRGREGKPKYPENNLSENLSEEEQNQPTGVMALQRYIYTHFGGLFIL